MSLRFSTRSRICCRFPRHRWFPAHPPSRYAAKCRRWRSYVHLHRLRGALVLGWKRAIRSHRRSVRQRRCDGRSHRTTCRFLPHYCRYRLFRWPGIDPGHASDRASRTDFAGSVRRATQNARGRNAGQWQRIVSGERFRGRDAQLDGLGDFRKQLAHPEHAQRHREQLCAGYGELFHRSDGGGGAARPASIRAHSGALRPARPIPRSISSWS